MTATEMFLAVWAAAATVAAIFFSERLRMHRVVFRMLCIDPVGRARAFADIDRQIMNLDGEAK